MMQCSKHTGLYLQAHQAERRRGGSPIFQDADWAFVSRNNPGAKEARGGRKAVGL